MILLLLCGACAGALATWVILRRWSPHANAERSTAMAGAGLSELASGTAHDINNALAPAQLSLELLRDTAGADPELLGLVARGVERCGRLASALTRYAEAELAGTDPIAPEALIEGLRSGLPQRPDIVVSVQVDPDPPELVGHRDRLLELLRQLADNALHAMAGGGQLTLCVRTRSAADAAAFADRAGSRAELAKDYPWVGFSITDTGAGLTPDALAEARQLFFTTKEKQGGTGLGLAIAERIAAAHGGFIDLSSTPGLGTRATAWLPVRPQATA
jgi:signal transduction histidine kinase